MVYIIEVCKLISFSKDTIQFARNEYQESYTEI
jgi:hypothetical protein